MSLVKETEARRLFGSAPPNPKSLAEWVERFQLKTVAQTYWGSLEKTPLRSSLELDTRYQEEARKVGEIFSDGSMLSVLMAVRQLSRDQKTPKVTIINAAEYLGLNSCIGYEVSLPSHPKLIF